MSDIKPARGDIIHARVRVVGVSSNTCLVVPAHWVEWSPLAGRGYHVKAEDVVCIAEKPLAVGDMVRGDNWVKAAPPARIVSIVDDKAWCRSDASEGIYRISTLKRFIPF